MEELLFKTKAGRYVEKLNGVLMLSSAFIYVAMSYMSGQEGIYETEWFHNLDIVVCTLIMFSWIVKCYVTPNKKSYLMHPHIIGELAVAVPTLAIVEPNLFEQIYMFIIVSRYLRIIIAANLLTANEKLSTNEVTSQLYKMVINLTLLIVISALLFTGIENKTNLSEIKEACHFG